MTKAEQSSTPPATPECRQFVKPDPQYCLACGGHAISHFPNQTDDETPENWKLRAIKAEAKLEIPAQPSPAGAAEWLKDWYEAMKSDDPYHFAEHDGPDCSGDGFPTTHCEYTFEMFRNSPMAKFAVQAVDAYAEHIVAPIRQERDEAKRLIQSDKNIDREWSDETLIQSVTIALNALHWRNLTIEAIEREVAQLRKELEPMINHCTNACQVFDGWHNDGTAWSEWDESVRKEMSGVVRKLYELSGAK
jgi:hypothetical protein